jgi:hypothetical protein
MLLTDKHGQIILDAFKKCKTLAELQQPACKLVTIQNHKRAEFNGNKIAAYRKERSLQQHSTLCTTPEQHGCRAWLQALG